MKHDQNSSPFAAALTAIVRSRSTAEHDRLTLTTCSRQFGAMKRNGIATASIVALFASALGCAENVGVCSGADKGRTPVLVGDTTMYAGQAIVNAACGTGCHASTATGEGRRGVPGGLDFDLRPISEEDAAGTRKNSRGETVVKLRSEQIAGLRARQRTILDHRDAMWSQLQQKLMPPDGRFESVLSTIFGIKSGTSCEKGKAYSKLASGRARETLRDWLACGAPLVESNGVAVEKSRATGTVGHQYPVCEAPAGEVVTITLTSLIEGPLASCMGCHPGLSPPNLRSVDDAAAAFAPGKKPACGAKPYVTPGDPDSSYLLDILKADDDECKHERMPLGGPYLSTSDLQKVADWITNGAPTVEGDAPLPSDGANDGAGADEVDGEAPDTDDPAADKPEADDETAPPQATDAGARDAGARDAGARDAGRTTTQDAGR